MKKSIVVIILAVLCIFALSGCGCEHEWKEATCTEPKTCSLCGETEGEPADHSWAEADCTTPKTCKNCKLTEGEALGHSWVEATETAPKTCTACRLTEGEPLVSAEETAFFASAGFKVVSDTVEGGLSINHSISYGYVNDPQNPSPLCYIYLTPLAGAADAYTADHEMWATFSENVRSFSEKATSVFYSDGFEVMCCVILFDDRNPESDILYAVIGGVAVYDFLAE